MTPHQFRHVAGKIILDQMPGALSLVSDLLGHKSTEPARKFYGGLDQVRAARCYDKLLARLRSDNPDEEED
jgi:integrase